MDANEIIKNLTNLLENVLEENEVGTSLFYEIKDYLDEINSELVRRRVK